MRLCCSSFVAVVADGDGAAAAAAVVDGDGVDATGWRCGASWLPQRTRETRRTTTSAPSCDMDANCSCCWHLFEAQVND